MFWKIEKTRRLLYGLMAFVMALMLWYTVNAKEQVERVVEVRLDYKGLPHGLVITDGQLNRISVRLRGPLELLRSLSSRDSSYTLDLSTMTVGSNIIPLSWSFLPDLRAYQVVEVIPSRLVLEVDRLLETKVPVTARLRESPLNPSVQLENVVINPDQVTVRGPASEVARLRRLTVEIPVQLENEDKVITDDIPVLAPPSVEVIPAAVKVTREISISRRNLALTRDVLLEYPDSQELVSQPRRVGLVVSVPRGAASDSGYMAQIQALVGNESQTLRGAGPWKVPVRIALPPGARLVNQNPPEVTVQRAPPEAADTRPEAARTAGQSTDQTPDKPADKGDSPAGQPEGKP